MRPIRRLQTAALVAGLVLGWAAVAAAARAGAAAAAADPITPTDYADRAHWLHLPPGSSHDVDVFYLYPTSYARSAGGPAICAVDDPGMIKSAALAYSRQATAFRTCADIYAPYYRQIDASYQLAQTPEQQAETIRGAPAVDATAAFAYLPVLLLQRARQRVRARGRLARRASLTRTPPHLRPDKYGLAATRDRAGPARHDPRQARCTIGATADGERR